MNVQKAVGMAKSKRLLVLNRMGLTEFPVSVIPGLADVLLQLDIRDNELQELPSDFANFQLLEQLNLSNNRLLVFPEVLWLLPRLETINCFGNSLTSFILPVTKTAAASTTTTTTKAVVNLPVTAIPESLTTARFSALVSLNLNKNHINRLPDDIVLLSKLETLSIDQNELTQLPRTMYQMKSLKHLHANFNRISVLEGHHLPRNLCTLDLANNLIPEVPPEIGLCRHLGFVDLSINQITFLPREVQQLTKLEEIKCVCNPLLQKHQLPGKEWPYSILPLREMAFRCVASLFDVLVVQRRYDGQGIPTWRKADAQALTLQQEYVQQMKEQQKQAAEQELLEQQQQQQQQMKQRQKSRTSLSKNSSNSKSKSLLPPITPNSKKGSKTSSNANTTASAEKEPTTTEGNSLNDSETAQPLSIDSSSSSSSSDRQNGDQPNSQLPNSNTSEGDDKSGGNDQTDTEEKNDSASNGTRAPSISMGSEQQQQQQQQQSDSKRKESKISTGMKNTGPKQASTKSGASMMMKSPLSITRSVRGGSKVAPDLSSIRVRGTTAMTKNQKSSGSSSSNQDHRSVDQGLKNNGANLPPGVVPYVFQPKELHRGSFMRLLPPLSSPYTVVYPPPRSIEEDPTSVPPPPHQMTARELQMLKKVFSMAEECERCGGPFLFAWVNTVVIGSLDLLPPPPPPVNIHRIVIPTAHHGKGEEAPAKRKSSPFPIAVRMCSDTCLQMGYCGKLGMTVMPGTLDFFGLSSSSETSSSSSSPDVAGIEGS